MGEVAAPFFHGLAPEATDQSPPQAADGMLQYK
jgi:hypothetical protein